MIGTVGVVGLGLIGGSLLLRLAEEGIPAIGFNRSPENCDAALSAGLRVERELARLARSVDVIVLAVPLGALPMTMRRVAAAASDATVITDVTSVKSRVRTIAHQTAPTLRFVGGHPMAGTEQSGFAAARADLFESAPWVLCREEDTDDDAWNEVAALVNHTGATVVETTAQAHDTAVARVSHVPHVLAAALATAAVAPDPEGARKLALELAAGSFRDGTRVAATREELTAAMCAGNRDAVLRALDTVAEQLSVARDALAASGDDGLASPDLTRFFSHARDVRMAWENAVTAREIHGRPPGSPATPPG